MDTAYISALAALAGTAIGGLTSFVTSWMTQHSQVKAQRIAAEREKRELLFGRFLEEAAKLYVDARLEVRARRRWANLLRWPLAPTLPS